MIKELVSIIVPVYNVEDYIQDCLNSILSQTYELIEVIVVDDGSTDKSGSLCDEFSQKDSRIMVIHQCNKGLSGARNAGLALANGKYVTFVDSDDVISPFFIEILCSEIDKSDIVCGDFCAVPEGFKNTDEILTSEEFFKTVIFSNKDAIREVYNNRFHGVDFISCSKLYNASLFKDYNISFPEGKIHEDTFTTYKLFYFARKISYIDKKMYFYRQREGSITRSSFNIKKMDIIDATRGECLFFYEKGEGELMSLAFFDYLRKAKGLVYEMIKEEASLKKEIKMVCDYIRFDLKMYGRIIDIPIKKKVYYSLVSRMPKILLFMKG